MYFTLKGHLVLDMSLAANGPTILYDIVTPHPARFLSTRRTARMDKIE